MYAYVNKCNPVIFSEDIDTLLNRLYTKTKIKLINKYNLYYEIYEMDKDTEEFIPTGEYILKAIMR